MEPKSISDIEKEYDLELDKVVKTIKEQKAKKILLQVPDGLKPYSTVIARYLENKTKAECIIWLGTCYGACDLPLGTEKMVDLVVQFGHSKWNYKRKDINIL